MENINTVDFHGLTIEEAFEKIDRIISRIRMAKKTEDYMFITGTGDLQLAILDYLKRDYQLECGLQWANHGSILVYIE